MKNIKYYLLALIILTFASISCKDEISNTNNSVIPDPPVPNPFISTHFVFHYTSYDSLYIRATADSIEQNYLRILTNLLTDTVSKTSVHFYKTYEDLVQGSKVPNLPVWAIGLATDKENIHMISPKHPNYQYQYMLTVLIHEFTHCVTLNINPSFGNNPRWLWESTAIYEAGGFIHPSQLPYMVQQNPPTLAQLNSISNTQIYEVGYLLAEFIVENWSRQHLKDMIINNGKISQTLGMTTAEFQTAWFQFVKQKYQI